MTKKDQCKKLMSDFFGPATAEKVDAMDENNCVEQCKTIVTNFLGPEKAKEFDNIN